MRNRIDIIQDIVSYKKNLKKLRSELSQYHWDLTEPILEITASDILKIIRKVLIGEITFGELEDWANLIECRDDFSFRNEGLQEIIFQLANPILHGEINEESLLNLESELQNQL